MTLSNAERQARWRAKRAAETERLRAAASAPSPDSAEIEALKHRIRELEATIARERQRFGEDLRAAYRKPGLMPVETFTVLASCLDPEWPTPDKERRGHAYTRLIQWRYPDFKDIKAP